MKLHSLLLSGALLFCAASPPITTQAQVFDLSEAPWSITADSTGTVGHRYGTRAAARAVLPNFVHYCDTVFTGKLAWTDNEVLTTTIAEACFLDAQWKGDRFPLSGNHSTINYANGCQSRAHIIVPAGWKFKNTVPLLAALGIIEGQGNSGYSDGSGSTGGTRFQVDTVNWKERLYPNVWIGLRSSTYGAGVNGAYAEGLIIRNIAFEGGRCRKAQNPARFGAGIQVENFGSGSGVYNVRCDCNDDAGIQMIGGIPIGVYDSRFFYNGSSGVLLSGTALSTGCLKGIECDDNGQYGIRSETYSGNAQVGGGSFEIELKCENGKNSPYRAQVPISMQGQPNLDITQINVSQYQGAQKTMIQLDPRKPSSGRYNVYVNVQSMRSCGGPDVGFTNAISDMVYQWSMPPNCAGTRFTLTDYTVDNCNRSTALVKRAYVP